MEVTRMHVRVVTVSEVTTEHPPENGLDRRKVVRLFDDTGKLLAYDDTTAQVALESKVSEMGRELRVANMEVEGLRSDVQKAEAVADAILKDKNEWQERANKYYWLAVELRNAMNPDNRDGDPWACLVCNAVLYKKLNWLAPENHTPECIMPKVQW